MPRRGMGVEIQRPLTNYQGHLVMPRRGMGVEICVISPEFPSIQSCPAGAWE